MDKISAVRRSANMRAIRAKDTAPEMAVRRLLRQMGFPGYRLHRKEVPGKPDIVFLGRRKAIFIHGCFWHQHSGCKIARMPQSRLDYWGPKLARNVSRDAANLSALEQSGWTVLVLWECEIKRAETLEARLLSFMDESALS